jgi:hypothetical protein
MSLVDEKSKLAQISDAVLGHPRKIILLMENKSHRCLTEEERERYTAISKLPIS